MVWDGIGDGRAFAHPLPLRSRPGRGRAADAMAAPARRDEARLDQPGLDVFCREPDGLRRIVRFPAFSTEPD